MKAAVGFPVDDEIQEWLDARISWIIDQFGLKYICSQNVATINQQLFEGSDANDESTLRLSLDRLCADLGIRSELVEYSVSDEELVLHQTGMRSGRINIATK